MLTGWNVIILRPEHQAQFLVEYVHSHQGTPIILPMLKIAPLPLSDAEIEAAVNNITTADYVLITSQNAVFSLSPPLMQALQQAHIISMGEATSQALTAKQIPVFFTALPGSTSESLLTELWLEAEYIAHKKIVLLVGLGGRKLLAQALAQRGANVIVIPVYEQQTITQDMAPHIQQWQNSKKQNCFIATSVNILQHLIASTPPSYHSWLSQQPLICISDRIADVAQKYGFKQRFIAKSPNPVHMERALHRMLEVCHTQR